MDQQPLVEPDPETTVRIDVGTRPGWPALPVSAWQDTRDTVQLWTQIVGKTKLALAPPLNHWWGITLHLNARGLTTTLMPTTSGGLEVAFDFIDHRLNLQTTDGRQKVMQLEPRSVADFYAEYRTHLLDLGVHIHIDPRPVELPDVVPFDEDTTHNSYDPHAMYAFWTSMVSASTVLTRFRGEFRGKASNVHFFWGAFDLAVTRFSGRPAPQHPGGIPHCPDWVMQEAYDAELSSCGYWPGGDDEGVFYSYAYPEPAGFQNTTLESPGASYDSTLGEFLLPYRTVRTATDPEATLLAFLHQTYDATTRLASWPPPLRSQPGTP